MITTLLAASLALSIQLTAQGARLEGEALASAIEELADVVERRYVFPDHAHAMAERLRARLWEGAYEAPDLATLAQRLTVDLRAVNGDRHLAVTPLARRTDAVPAPEELHRRGEEEARRGNHGFKKLEILEDNIGYLELTGFATAAAGGEAAVAAMAFLANVDALVIDLRANGGGEPSMIQLLCSYFFAEPTLLNTFEWRGKEGREEYWTSAEVRGKKRADLPLFVLTSAYTFSAAEEFAYDLKCLGRATLVGARTGGGAHPGDTHVIAGVLGVFVPNGRAVNPITGTNWEGTGVAPDLEVPAGQALEAALGRARHVVEQRRGASGR